MVSLVTGKKKKAVKFYLTAFFRGTTRNRTGDTRIFSPYCISLQMVEF